MGGREGFTDLLEVALWFFFPSVNSWDAIHYEGALPVCHCAGFFFGSFVRSYYRRISNNQFSRYHTLVFIGLFFLGSGFCTTVEFSRYHTFNLLSKFLFFFDLFWNSSFYIIQQFSSDISKSYDTTYDTTDQKPINLFLHQPPNHPSHRKISPTTHTYLI